MPLHRLPSALQTLRPLTSFSRRAILDFQGAQLRRLVRHAYENVPLYRRLFDSAGLHPRHIQGVQDLHRIPIVSRALLQETPVSDRLARGVAQSSLIPWPTSGSSGRPLLILRTRAEDQLLMAVRLRQLFSLGLRLTDRRAAVALPDPPIANFRWDDPLRGRIGLLIRRKVSCLDSPESVVSQLRALNPDVIEGYPGSLARAAILLTDDDRRLIRPRFIVSGAETLSPALRRDIQQGFQAPVFNYYGADEFNLIAAECPSSGRLHLMETSILAEVLLDGQPVQPMQSGQLVATALHSFAMPIIRYNLGDRVTLGEELCPCGAPLRTLVHVQGRELDRFTLPDGKQIHPFALVDPLLQAAPWICQFQVVQHRRDHVVVSVTSNHGNPIPPQALAQIQTKLAAILGPAVTVQVEHRPELPQQASGKFRPYRCLAE
ncbi:MAG: phenylacetate--CoA ligase family protein [Bryobacterales bacterium]|nr:phenylacetate--CoA ligase family protein [Bryobacterales bacterium]